DDNAPFSICETVPVVNNGPYKSLRETIGVISDAWDTRYEDCSLSIHIHPSFRRHFRPNQRESAGVEVQVLHILRRNNELSIRRFLNTVRNDVAIKVYKTGPATICRRATTWDCGFAPGDLRRAHGCE